MTHIPTHTKSYSLINKYKFFMSLVNQLTLISGTECIHTRSDMTLCPCQFCPVQSRKPGPSFLWGHKKALSITNKINTTRNSCFNKFLMLLMQFLICFSKSDRPIWMDTSTLRSSLNRYATKLSNSQSKQLHSAPLVHY